MRKIAQPRYRILSPVLGWSGFLAALGGWMVYQVNPSWRLYASLSMLFALGLWAAFFILHFETLKAFSSRRSTQLGFNSLLMTLIVVLIIGAVNFISANHSVRFDLSETGQYTLSPQTFQVLKDLNRDVKILAFVSDQSRTRSQIKDLVDNYAYHNPRVTYTLIDPDRKPTLAKQYGVTQYDTLVVQSGPQETQVKTPNEQELTNALIRVGKDQRRIIRFLEDHGEHSPADSEKAGYSMVKEALQKQGFEVGSLSLLETASVPSDTSVLVIAGPQKGLLPAEIEKLNSFLDRQGKILLLLDPQTASRLEGWAADWGLQINGGLIIDPLSRLLSGDFTIPVVSKYLPHPITENFNLATFFPVSQPVQFDPTRSAEFDFKPIAETSESSWVKTHLKSGRVEFNPAEDRRGPLTLAAVVTRKSKTSETHEHENTEAETGKTGVVPAPESTLAVFGDSDFASNAYFNFSGNGDLFLNTVAWLAQEANLVSIRPKEPTFTPLFLSRSQGTLLMYVSLILLPGAVVISGILIRKRRRRL